VVVGIATDVDAVEVEGRKAIGDKGADCFGGVTLPGIARVEDVAEFALLMLFASQKEQDLANDGARFFEDDSKAEDGAVVGEGCLDFLAVESVAGLGAVSHFPGEVTDDVRERVVGAEGVQVGVLKGAQFETVGS
jgi:hypothetical protein